MAKSCKKCKDSKDEDSFFTDNKAKDGLQGWCKACKSASISAYLKERRAQGLPKAQSTRLPTEVLKVKREEAKISRNVSRRMRYSLNGIRKAANWEVLVGYSLCALRKHMEERFTPDMSWDNYGTYWHVDHIRPIDSFNITDSLCPDFKECWALSNLQPLHWLDNIVKSNKYTVPSSSGAGLIT